jgi:hypothetical protein
MNLFRKVKKANSFTIATKLIKHLKINFIKEMNDLYSENYRTLMKEIKVVKKKC